MKCPVDGATLTMSERTGIEIDYCPECRGVWLDRGELDKIIDRGASGGATAPAYTAPAPRDAGYDRRDGGGYDGGHGQGGHGRPRKKREHWLSEIFD